MLMNKSLLMPSFFSQPIQEKQWKALKQRNKIPKHCLDCNCYWSFVEHNFSSKYHLSVNFMLTFFQFKWNGHERSLEPCTQMQKHPLACHHDSQALESNIMAPCCAWHEFFKSTIMILFEFFECRKQSHSSKLICKMLIIFSPNWLLFIFCFSLPLSLYRKWGER